jgi:hypothetical protein
MSRYSPKPIRPTDRVDLGFDALTGTYFLQVRRRNFRGQLETIVWLGHGVGGQEGGGIIGCPNTILDEAMRYAYIPADLLERLVADRDFTPVLVESKPVIYAGLANQEIWRYRAGEDPASGTPLSIKESPRFSWMNQVAMALLRDFLGEEQRVRRIVDDFAASVIKGLKLNRPWLLTEREMQEGVYQAESKNGLRWIEAAKCYSGEGKRGTAESQLRWASNVANSHPIEETPGVLSTSGV